MKGTTGSERRARIVIAAVDDLFFVTKIETAASAAQVELIVVPSADHLWRQLESLTPEMIILDLNSAACSPLETIGRLKATPRLAAVRLIGFYSHVQEELQRAAQRAGCDSVVPRSVFSAKLPDLLSAHS